MNGQFTPKKHSCLKDGVTRQELMETLDQIKLLKLKTNTQIGEYEKTIEEQAERIRHYNAGLQQAEQKIDELLMAKNEETAEYENKLRAKDDEIEQLLSEVYRLEQQLNHTNRDIDESQTRLTQSMKSITQKDVELAEAKQQLLEVGACLGVGLTPSSESDKALLASVREYGGLRGLLDKMKEQKLRSLQEKHALNDTIRKLEFDIHRISNEKEFDDKVIAIRDKQVSGLQETISIFKENTANYLSRISELEKQLYAKHNENTLLSEQMGLVESKFRTASLVQDELQEEIIELKQLIADKQSDLEQVTRQKALLAKRAQYEQLVGSVIDESQDYRQLQDTLSTFTKFRTEYYRNVDKIQFLCELLDT